ncbi:MAG: enoyl-CoA hydratase-related protein [Pseudomonadota bacterium]|nr:enoyl-CoA hydratase-related protein [Pseudomonadota bacterium]
MNFQNLLIDTRQAVRTITINRPDKLNALDRLTISELRVAVEEAGEDAGVRVVVITGAGPKAFIAGADISELAQLNGVQALEFSRYGQVLMTRIERLGKPVIARINGFALGGGMELAMACHLRIASDNAKFGQPEINLGVLPGFGGTQRPLRLVGRGAALEMCLLGETITAARALELGVLTRVVPVDQLDTEVARVAAQLAASATQALNGVLNAVVLGGEASIDVGLDYESQAFGICAATADMREGTAAFLQRRKPKFGAE